jgi:hypothetical protein
MAHTPPRSTPADSAASHEVLHLVADRAEVGPAHAHIVGVETATDGEPRRWPIVDFVEAFRRGERFYLSGAEDVAVEPEVCAHCSQVTIATHRRSEPT